MEAAVQGDRLGVSDGVGRAGASGGDGEGDRQEWTPVDELPTTDHRHLPADLLHPVHGGRAGAPAGVGQLLVVPAAAGDVDGPCGVQVLDVVQLSDRACGQQVADTRARAYADHGADPGVPGLPVQVEHLQGRLPVVADVQVVGTGRDRGPQHGQAEAVVRADRVEHDVRALQSGVQGGAVGDLHHERPHRGATGAVLGEPAHQRLGRLQVPVGHHDLGDAGKPGRHPYRHGAHRS